MRSRDRSCRSQKFFAFSLQLLKLGHRYPKLMGELHNRNIIRVCMENLSIDI